MKTKYLYLDGLRGLAALYVLYHHAKSLIPSDSNWPTYGHFAVTLFIVLSGFSLMLPVAKSGEIAGGAKGFFARRARRILPTYAAALLLSVIVLLVMNGAKDKHIFLLDLIGHIPLLQDVTFPGSWSHFGINMPMWSVAVEWHIYAFFPIFVFLFHRRGWLPTTVTAITLAYICYFALLNSPIQIIGLPYYGLFALGMAAAVVCHDAGDVAVWIRAHCKAVMWILSGLLLAAMTLIPYAIFYAAISQFDLLMGSLVAMLLIVIQGGEFGGASRFLSSKPLRILGSCSYSLYLLHLPLLVFFNSAFHYVFRHTPLSQHVVMYVLIAPTVIVCAYIFSLLFERPFLRKTSHANSETSVSTPAGASVN